MKAIRTILFFLTIANITLSSCKKKETYTLVKGNYLIVGRLGGFTVAGAHTKYYEISSAGLRKDEHQLMQAPPPELQDFRFDIIMPQQDYMKVADLPNAIPTELLGRNNATIGNMLPDAGFTDVLANINGINYRWSFEADLEQESSSIKQFCARLAKDLP